MSSSSDNSRAILVGALAAIGAFVVFRGAGTSAAPLEPSSAVPANAFLVVSADVAELRRSPIYDAVFAQKNADSVLPPRFLSLGGLERACGFDPFSRIERLAIAVPEKEGEHDLGLAAKVNVTTDELKTCKARLDEQRGGASGTSSGPTERGSFVVLDGAGPSAGTGTGAGRPRIAYGQGGLLVVSTGAWFDAMLDAANGAAPRLSASADHAALRSGLTQGDGWRSPTIVATAILPSSLRDRLRSEMQDEGAAGDSGQSVMAGVLGVSAVGLAIRAGSRGGLVDARLDLVCDTENGCAAVEKLVAKQRLSWSKDLSLRLVGLGTIIDSIDTKLEGKRLRVTASANADMLSSTLERIMRFKARGRAAPPGLPPAGGQGAPPSRRPDEVVPAPDR